MKAKLHTTVALVIGIVIAVNLLSSVYHFRADLTENHQYTLSKATREIVRHLEEPVTVTAYFSKDMPPAIMQATEQFKDMLVEYANLSGGQIIYKFVNPGASAADEQAAQEAGIQPVLINVREKDQMKQQKAYLGATVAMGKQTEVIPVLGPGTSGEYALSTAIKKISVKVKPTVGFLQGNGEPSLDEMPEAEKQLGVLYDVKPVTITDSTRIPPGVRTMAIIGPSTPFSTRQLARLDSFSARGGNLLVALNHAGGNMQMGGGTFNHSGLAAWLAGKGIVVGDNFIIDAQCASIPQQQQQGGFSFQTNISFPYFPVISHFAKHPVTTGLENVVLQFASTISYQGDSSMQFTPLAFTSALSDSLDGPQRFNLGRQWTQQDFTQQGLVVAAAVTGAIGGKSGRSKMVVVTDGDFPVNGPAGQAHQLAPDNVSLLSNAIDWLSDDTGLISLRTKAVTARPIAQISDGAKAFLKYLNFLLPLLAVILYGLIRFRANRRKRQRRQQADYSRPVTETTV